MNLRSAVGAGFESFIFHAAKPWANISPSVAGAWWSLVTMMPSSNLKGDGSVVGHEFQALPDINRLVPTRF